MSASYLPSGLPAPRPLPDGLDAPFWEGLGLGRIRVQRCNACTRIQWGPEWICHHCLSFDMGWTEVAGRGRIYSWERVWHPVHPALREHGPYLVVLVELTGTIRMPGNLLGDPQQAVEIGATVEAVFEPHGGPPPYTLLQWRLAAR